MQRRAPEAYEMTILLMIEFVKPPFVSPSFSNRDRPTDLKLMSDRCSIISDLRLNLKRDFATESTTHRQDAKGLNVTVLY